MTYEPSWIEEDQWWTHNNNRPKPSNGSRNTSEYEPKVLIIMAHMNFMQSENPRWMKEKTRRRVAKIRNYTELTHNLDIRTRRDCCLINMIYIYWCNAITCAICANIDYNYVICNNIINLKYNISQNSIRSGYWKI